MRREGSQQQEFSSIGPGQSGDHVGGANRLRLSILTGHKSRQLPQILLIVEGLWIEHVIRAIDLGLHTKQDLRISRVRPPIGGASGPGGKRPEVEILPVPEKKVRRSKNAKLIRS